MYASQPNRTVSALASAALVGGIAVLLMAGLRAEQIVEGAQSLVAIDLSPPRPSPSPTPTPPPPAAKSAPKDEPGQRNLRNEATQIVAVVPPVILLPPPPVVVATTAANTGNATQSGQSDRTGPGQGAGSYGDGLGGGGSGGDGAGEPVIGPRRIRGRLSFDDLPEGMLQPGEEAVVEVRYAVETNGRATGCRAIRSSGIRALDALACRLIEARFVYRPARDAAGRPVRSIIEENHTWLVDEDMSPRRR